MILTILLSVACVFLFLLVVIISKRLKDVQTTDEGMAERLKNIARLRSKVEILTAAAIPIHEAYQAVLTTKLSHSHTPDMDKLLAKLGPPNTLTPEEITQLEIGLAARMQDYGDMIDEAERITAKILPDVVRLAEIEKDNQNPDAVTENLIISKPESHKEEVKDEHETV